MEKETPVTLIHAPFLNRFARHFRVLAYLTAFLTVLLTVAPAYPMGSNEPGVRVSNVRAEVSGLRVTVRYDLAGSPHRRYNVALVLRNRDNPSFRYFPKTLSGDVGAGEYAGRDKVIEWDMSREFPQGLQRNGYFFVVVAEQAGGSSHSVGLFTWIGAAAITVVAVAAYLIVRRNGGPTSPASYPNPPGRP